MLNPEEGDFKVPPKQKKEKKSKTKKPKESIDKYLQPDDGKDWEEGNKGEDERMDLEF